MSSGGGGEGGPHLRRLRDDLQTVVRSSLTPLMESGTSPSVPSSLATHLAGLSFRERNAGTKIDEHMTEAGFDVTIGVDPDTGFVFGGSKDNCGTWMDKMGSSKEAGNKGVPSTPRSGADGWPMASQSGRAMQCSRPRLRWRR